MATLDPATADSRLPTNRPFTLQQAVAAGLSRSVVARLRKQGLIRPVIRSVYVDASTADTTDLRAAAIALVVHSDGVITDLSAAWLHGAQLQLPGDYLPRVSVFLPPDRTRVRSSSTNSGIRALAKRDVEMINGLRVTTPLRTALDLGRLLKRGPALASMDALLRVGRFTRADLRAALPRFKGYRGVVQLRDLIPLCDPRAESPQESVLRLRWLEAQLPAPVPQYVVYDNGAPVYRLDLADPTVKYAAEYDGQDHHFTASQRKYDERRRDWLRRHGWTIIVFDRDSLASPNARTILRQTHQQAAQRLHAAA
ncbi:type IV toxin-antitoxin system AbiEi family antitoxin domain-containing protein [Microlunatus sp. GCM10028923]|uniref:type IV toxin-antitoxin system AbiEi family antitoxin domain-containing protein n=1 Tax=Microlunatus sp. GCM10028923 TaxID=3273400 RepID=UPI003609A193